MVLKTIRTVDYSDECSTESNRQQETCYYPDLNFVQKDLALEHSIGKNEILRLFFNDGREISLVLRTMKEEGVWYDLYDNVFLMNDEGKTIERLV